MRICVIGAGAAGICAARRVQEDAEKNGIQEMKIRVFEQSKQLGGTWVFDEATGIHSSMYSNLRTNIPRELMAYDDFPFLASTLGESSFPKSEKVLQYLAEFARPIQHLIQFNTRVLSVHKMPNEQWEVKFEQKGFKSDKELFDAIFVCIGHYSAPRLPDFVGKLCPQKLPWIHSHDYRRAEHYAGKNVAVVGAGLSGSDIVLQLAKQAKKVYFLHMSDPTPKSEEMALKNGIHKNDEIKVDARGIGLPAAPFYFRANERPQNCEERCRVVDATESSLILADGTELGMPDGLDAIVFCTGYRYSIPFLEAEGIINCPKNGAYVSPIWAKCVHVHHPRSIFIIGLPFPILPFSQFESQIRLGLALMHGRVQPPPIEEMLAEESDRLSEMKKHSIAAKNFHKLPLDPNASWEYFDWLDERSGHGKKHREPAIYAINLHFRKARIEISTINFRDVCYVLKNDGQQFEVVKVENDGN